MSTLPEEHRQQSPKSMSVAVITVSDTRTEATDRGGALIVKLLHASGHRVTERQIVPDEPSQLAPLLQELARRPDVEVVLLTGGTGISSRDQTYETVRGLLSKALPGYGELFRMLSFAEVGAAAMLSRTIGGLIGETVVLTMPGSPAAVRLAMEKLVLPELGHLVSQATN